MIELKGKEIYKKYQIAPEMPALELGQKYRVIEVDSDEGKEPLFDTLGFDYEYIPGKTYRVDSIDGIVTIGYVYQKGDLKTRERVNLTLNAYMMEKLRLLSEKKQVAMGRMVDEAILAMYGEEFEKL